MIYHIWYIRCKALRLLGISRNALHQGCSARLFWCSRAFKRSLHSGASGMYSVYEHLVVCKHTIVHTHTHSIPWPDNNKQHASLNIYITRTICMFADCWWRPSHPSHPTHAWVRKLTLFNLNWNIFSLASMGIHRLTPPILCYVSQLAKLWMYSLYAWWTLLYLVTLQFKCVTPVSWEYERVTHSWWSVRMDATIRTAIETAKTATYTRTCYYTLYFALSWL